jgi:hypothetical protein
LRLVCKKRSRANDDKAEAGDGPQRNHYLVGDPPYRLGQLRSWYEVVLGRPV